MATGTTKSKAKAKPKGKKTFTKEQRDDMETLEQSFLEAANEVGYAVPEEVRDLLELAAELTILGE